MNIEEKNEEFKKPEFIYIEEPFEEKVNAGFEEQRLFMAMHDMQNVQFPIGLRVFAFFGAIFCGLITVILAIISLAWFLVALCCLFQIERMCSPFWSSYALFKKGLVLTLGFMIGLFSPQLGIGFVVMYFLMHGEKINQSIMDKLSGRFEPRN